MSNIVRLSISIIYVVERTRWKLTFRVLRRESTSTPATTVGMTEENFEWRRAATKSAGRSLWKGPTFDNIIYLALLYRVCIEPDSEDA